MQNLEMAFRGKEGGSEWSVNQGGQTEAVLHGAATSNGTRESFQVLILIALMVNLPISFS